MTIIQSTGYDGEAHEIDEVQWARLAQFWGSDYGVAGRAGQLAADAWKVTTVPTAPRATVAIAPGLGFGHGVLDDNDAPVNLELPTVTSGSRWILVSAYRQWEAIGGATAFRAIAGTGVQEFPSGRRNEPGVEDDQPLALVQVTAGQTVPTKVIDLRCWSGNAGLLAGTTDALAYLDRLGSRVTVGAEVWTRVLDGQGSAVWRKVGVGAGAGTAGVITAGTWSGVSSIRGTLTVEDPGYPYYIVYACRLNLSLGSSRWDAEVLVTPGNGNEYTGSFFFNEQGSGLRFMNLDAPVPLGSSRSGGPIVGASTLRLRVYRVSTGGTAHVDAQGRAFFARVIPA